MRRVLGMALVASVAAGRAFAQPGNSDATADQLFNEARELTKANQWAEACPKFEASLRMDSALGTRLNLAACYEHVGKLARAWGLYRESIDLAKQAGDVKRRDYAQTHADALEPRLARLVITAPGKSPTGFVVRWDGSPIEAGALGAALYVDTGPHTLIAFAPGFEAFSKTVTLIEGKTETLAIPDLTAAHAPGPALPPPSSGGPATTPELVVAPSPGLQRPAPTETVDASSSTRRYVAIGLGATGLATAGVGLWFGVKARSSFRDAKALCGPNLICKLTDYNRGKQLIHDARSDATVSTVLIAAGGAAVVAGAVVFLTRSNAREQPTPRIVPVAHEGGAGLALMGRF